MKVKGTEDMTLEVKEDLTGSNRSGMGSNLRKPDGNA